MSLKNQSVLFFNLPIIRSLLKFSIHTCIIAISYLFSHVYLFPSIQNTFEANSHNLFLVISQLILVYFFGLHKRMMRFSSIHDLAAIIQLTLASFLINIIYAAITFPHFILASKAVVANHLFLFLSLGTLRLSVRFYHDYLQNLLAGNSHNNGQIRTLIVGAGNGADLLFRHLKRQQKQIYHIVGFVDDDPKKQKYWLHNTPILGVVDDLRTLVQKHSIQEVLIAIPSASPGLMQKIAKSCFEAKIEAKTMPKLSEILSSNSDQINLRKIRLEDLLAREPIKMDMDPAKRNYAGKDVLITGAAGSIGEELVRQVAALSPKTILLLDKAESPLYLLFREMETLYPQIVFVPLLANIADPICLDAIFKAHKPNIILHAAAYKHVPLLEHNLYQAFLVNVLGTRYLLNYAEQYNAERFVFISTDKAVNPTNILGVTKRIAELLCQSYQARSTKFIVVRFGNVIGSQGSVIPLFTKQIQSGGPITVTHPDIQRYFMMIPEAAQLVLQASIVGQGGEIFVFDMGEQVKIIDLALNMINLFGFEPHTDIKIVYSGLRPGEKLYEELFDHSEKIHKTHHEKLNMAIAEPFNKDLLNAKIDICLDLTKKMAPREAIIAQIKQIVTSYQSESLAS